VNPTFTFDAELWLHNKGSWVFLTVPQDESDEIHEVAPHPGGFGSVRVGVQLGDTRWKTSVFPDSTSGCFLLPVKKDVRKAEQVDIGDVAAIALTVLMD